MTIGKRILGGYILVLLCTVLIAAAGLVILSVARSSYDSFIDVNERILSAALELRIAYLRQSDGYRGFLLYGEDSYLESWTEGQEEFDAAMKTLSQLVTLPEGRKTLEEISTKSAGWDEKQRAVIELRRQGRTDEALAQSEDAVRPLRQVVTDLVPPFIERQTQALEQARAALASTINLVSLAMIALSVLSVLSGITVSILLTRSISAGLRAVISQLAASTTEITAMIGQVASGAAETATAVSETTTTVEEVKQTAQIASQKAKVVSENAQKAAQVAQGGRGAVAQSVEGMERIRAQMESIAQGVVQLSEQGQAIGEIIATVNDLAEQSNLLAVNAAIEAARAGEQGKGFGVVAQEVKNLAEQSKQATAQVRGILGDIQRATAAAVLATEQGSKAVEAGVKQVSEAGQSIRQLADSIQEAAQAATQIAASSQQQLVGMDQVAIAMENINQASVQNVAGARQSEQAAHNLTDLASRLRAMIEVAKAV